MRTFAMLAALALLAGCIGNKDDPVETGSLDAADAPAAAPGAGGAPPTSGAPAPTPAAGAAANSGTNASAGSSAPPTIVKQPLSFSGHITQGVCAGVAPVGCFGLFTEGGGHYGKIESTGVPTHAQLTLTWTAETPGSTTLAFGISAWHSCGDDCLEGGPATEFVQGASPLTIDLDLPALAEGDSFYALAYAPNVAPEPALVIAHTAQAFAVDGMISVRT